LGMTRRTMIAAATAASMLSARRDARAAAPAAIGGWQRNSLYVPVADGLRIAVDVFLPADGSGPVAGRFPVLLTITQYRRAFINDKGEPSYAAGSLLPLVKEGYAIVVADTIGKGASFGSRRGPWCEEEANMAHDLVEWCAQQAWSSGKVGMFGPSYLAGIQYAAAWKKPRGLAAIVPPIVPFDNFDNYCGLIPPRGPFYEIGNAESDLKTLPVDADSNRVLLQAAVAQHAANKSTGPMPFRDSLSPFLGVNYYREVSPCEHIKAIEASGVAIHHIGYWGNWLINGSVLGFWNFGNPGKLTLLSQSAGIMGGTAYVAEHKRWFDYWLKGIDNGVMREPRVRYSVANGDPAQLNTSDTWPPKGIKEFRLYLASGVLDRSVPARTLTDARAVDYDVTMANRIDKGLVYVSAPFETELLIVGHATMRLWASSSATDGDFIAYLQDVAPDGSARDIADGRLRASLRALHSPPYKTNGLPWHRAYAKDFQPLKPGQPSELQFDLLPTAWLVKPGHRLRLIVSNSIPANSQGADLFNLTPRLAPVPEVAVHSVPGRASYLSLPVA
jgi:uncharacterized protein